MKKQRTHAIPYIGMPHSG